MSETDYQKRNETHELFIPVAERLGDKVVEFHDVSKGFGDRLLIDKLSFTVPPGAIVGIIGPNGAGKSTLFKMLTGQDKPDSGEVVVGPTVKISYVDQSRDCLDGSKTVFEELADGADIITIASSRSAVAPISAASTSRAATSRRTSATSPAASADACTGEDADDRRQPAAARRTVERPRRRDPARAGRRPARIRRLRHDHQP